VRFIAACVNGLDLTVAGFAHVDPKRIGRPELRGGGRLRQRARSYPARGRGTRHSMVAAERIRSVTTASYLASWPWERKPSGRASSLGSRFGSGCRTQDASSSGRCETVAAPRARCRYLACFDGFHRGLPRCPRPAWCGSTLVDIPSRRAQSVGLGARIAAASGATSQSVGACAGCGALRATAGSRCACDAGANSSAVAQQ
jgi:hypothetical protein